MVLRKNPISALFLAISAILFFTARMAGPGSTRFLAFDAAELPCRWYGVFTYGFVHTEWIHFGINMVILVWVGMHIERSIGLWRFLSLVLAAVFTGGITLLVRGGEGIGFQAGAAALIFYYHFADPWKRELPFSMPNILIPAALIILVTAAAFFRLVPPEVLYSPVAGAVTGVLFVGIHKNSRKLAVVFSIMLLLFLFFFAPDPLKPVNRDTLAEVVGRDAVVFSDEIPPEIPALLGRYDVLIIGEYHDISGHQELFVSLLPGLYEEGFRYVVIEWHQAESWILNDYVQRSEPFRLLERMERHYGVILEGVRKFNSGLPEGEGFQVKALDINWNKDIFLNSLEAFVRIHNGEGLLYDFFESINSGGRYGSQLRRLQNDLQDHQSQYIADLGEAQWAVLADMVYAELRSHGVRSIPGLFGFRERFREEVMKDLADRYIQREGRAVINTGSYHAQKEYRFGTPKQWLAEYLADSDHPLTGGNVYSLVAVPAQGTMRMRNEIRSFSLEERSSPDELFLLMSKLAGDKLVFLSLDDEVFLNHNIEVNYHYNQLNYPVKRHYDGFILLPHVEFIGYDPGN